MLCKITDSTLEFTVIMQTLARSFITLLLVVCQRSQFRFFAAAVLTLELQRFSNTLKCPVADPKTHLNPATRALLIRLLNSRKTVLTNAVPLRALEYGWAHCFQTYRALQRFLYR